MSTFIIAEAGSCHDGSLDKAYRLIDAVKACGADAAKFQYWSSAERLAARRNAPDYLDVYRRYQMPREWLPLLKERCDKAGVEFMATTYYAEDIPTVAPYVRRFKVASFEAGDDAFVAAHYGYGKEIIVSCGMGQEPGDFPRWPWDLPPNTPPVMCLHCVSSYPCSPDQANLARLSSDEPYDGLSDHTTSTLTGAVAVGAGMTVLEKHVRLSDTDPGNQDYETALEADCRCSTHERCALVCSGECFAEYVRNARLAERMMGTGEAGAMPCEEKMMRYRVRP